MKPPDQLAALFQLPGPAGVGVNVRTVWPRVVAFVTTTAAIVVTINEAV
jgi:hypothetical protein